jgi:small-conductance mechanosensitive channel
MLREVGVEIAFPQRDLHLRSVDPALADLLRAQGPREDAG